MAFDKDGFMRFVAFQLGQELSKEAPKQSTRLARSFTSTSSVDIKGDTITYHLPHYAESVINGSAPHVIEAKNAKSLAVPIKDWTGKTPNPYGSKKGFPMLSKDGKFVLLGKKVNHPGNQPNPFIKDVLHRKLRDIIEEGINRFNK